MRQRNDATAGRAPDSHDWSNTETFIDFPSPFEKQSRMSSSTTPDNNPTLYQSFPSNVAYTAFERSRRSSSSNRDPSAESRYVNFGITDPYTIFHSPVHSASMSDDTPNWAELEKYIPTSLKMGSQPDKTKAEDKTKAKEILRAAKKTDPAPSERSRHHLDATLPLQAPLTTTSSTQHPPQQHPVFPSEASTSSGLPAAVATRISRSRSRSRAVKHLIEQGDFQAITYNSYKCTADFKLKAWIDQLENYTPSDPRDYTKKLIQEKIDGAHMVLRYLKKKDKATEKHIPLG
ncbi:hypothetical protein CBS101457_006101 [Exobasidium rhododendri]|nr:hypothetical protein CBS101457_006101 [Exobasidium rhododendri]